MPEIMRPRPAVNADNRFFFEALNAGRIVVQKCLECGELRHPPVPMCPHCHSLQWSENDMSGDGELVSFVVMHHPIVPPFEPGYIVVVVELMEGVRVVANIEGTGQDALWLGMPLRVAAKSVDAELSLLVAYSNTPAGQA